MSIVPIEYLINRKSIKKSVACVKQRNARDRENPEFKNTQFPDRPHPGSIVIKNVTMNKPEDTSTIAGPDGKLK